MSDARARLRIAHFVSGLRVGGKERVVLQLARAARRDGHDVELITHDARRPGDHVFDVDGLAVTSLERGPGFDLHLVRRLAALMRIEQYDVVHAHADTALVYAAAARMFVGRAAPAIVGTFHVRPSHPTPRARWVTRQAARRATVTVVSDALKRSMVASGWIEGATTIGNGVDTSQFSPGAGLGLWRSKVGACETSVVIAHVGRFDPIKRQPRLLAAVRSLCRGGLDVRVVFAGDGPTRKSFEASLTDDDPVLVVPHVDDVADLMRDADLLALCSEHEASPCVVVEALACGLPVVSTDVGDVRDVLGQPPAGRVVADSQDFTEALRELALDAPRRRALADTAVARAQAHDVELTWQRYSDVYRGAL